MSRAVEVKENHEKATEEEEKEKAVSPLNSNVRVRSVREIVASSKKSLVYEIITDIEGNAPQEKKYRTHLWEAYQHLMGKRSQHEGERRLLSEDEKETVAEYEKMMNDPQSNNVQIRSEQTKNIEAMIDITLDLVDEDIGRKQRR